jgi:UDP-N-acetyl-D-galactosamine dehydrogenase
MGQYIANKVIKLLIQNEFNIKKSKILVLGFTFKENCPDTRNTKVIDVVRELEDFGVQVDIYDPHADAQEVRTAYNIQLTTDLQSKYEGIVLAVAHHEFRDFDLEKHQVSGGVIYDVKAFFDKHKVNARL